MSEMAQRKWWVVYEPTSVEIFIAHLASDVGHAIIHQGKLSSIV